MTGGGTLDPTGTRSGPRDWPWGSPWGRSDDEEDGHMTATFDNALEGLRMTGASVDTREMVGLLVRHGREEGQILATYEALAGESPDEATRYLVGLILEDEHRHHRLLAELANAMAWDVRSESPQPATPWLTEPLTGELLEQTRRLVKAERSDERALRKIRRRLRPYARTTLWSLIIDMMILDTKKHATMLRFLERQGR